MTKCSVGRTRKRRAGSKSDAAAADGDNGGTRASVMQAVKTATIADLQARTTTLRTGRRPGLTRDPRKPDAEEERGKPEQTGADEEQAVGLNQRPADREPLDHHTRESLGEFADVGVRRTQQRVLRGR